MTERFDDVGILRLDSRHLPVYLFAVGGVVLDTGFARAGKVAGSWIVEQAPDLVLVTHHHEDHSGNMGRVAQAGIPMLAHPLTIDIVARGFPVPGYRKRIWGLPSLATAQPAPERLETRAGSLDLLPAPGHAADMLVAHDAGRGRLFSADLYIATRMLYIRDDEDPVANIGSLHRILALDFDVVFCAHRGVLRDGRRRLLEKLAFLEDVQGRVMELASRGAGEREITRRVLGREGFMYYYTRGQFARRHYVRSFLSTAPAAASPAL